MLLMHVAFSLTDVYGTGRVCAVIKIIDRTTPPSAHTRTHPHTHTHARDDVTCKSPNATVKRQWTLKRMNRSRQQEEQSTYVKSYKID